MKSLQRKDQIRFKAQVLFRERGYAETSMRDLADSLGIEAASLYNHVTSKEEILQSICFGMAESFFTAIDTIMETQQSSREKLRAAIQAHLDVITENSDASAVFQNEWRHMHEPFLTDFKNMRRRYEQCFRMIIEEGIMDGTFRDVDSRLAARIILSGTNWTYESYRSRAVSTLEKVNGQIIEMLIAGIEKKKK
jgi:TetR/AcrR family transcriptional regulator, cholesterol catabolism regulator